MSIRFATITLLCLLLLALSVLAQDEIELPPADSGMADMAILPFENLPGRTTARNVIMPYLHYQLRRHGWKIVTDAEVRPTLRRKRIRSTGEIMPSEAKFIRDNVGTDLMMIGTINTFEYGAGLEVGLSLRIYSASEERVVWAADYAANALDYGSMFETKQIDNIKDLSWKVIDQALESLPTKDEFVVHPVGRPVSVIAFENISLDPKAGRIATMSMATGLLNAGLDLIEPGLMTEVFLKLRTSQTGGIDFPTLEALRKETKIEFLVTGSVEVYNALRGSSRASTPTVEVAVRVIDVATGKIVTTYFERRDGADNESIFRLGRGYSAERLLSETLYDIAGKIGKKSQHLMERAQK
jgi:hypothetical protein